MTLRLGTRGSDLARTQSLGIAAALAAHGVQCELSIIRTAGDQSSAPSFAAIGPQGVFVREIEQALLEGTADFAVHSFKDLPSISPPELVIAAVPQRFDAADVLLTRADAAVNGDALLPLAHGARVGTSSARRRVWLKHLRPDLKIEPLRGNVPTRLRRLCEGHYDAILLAAAGLERLRASELGAATRAHLAALASHRLDPQIFVPAPAQGALALQCRADDVPVRQALAALTHAPSARAVAVERHLLARVEGGCDVAFGAYCWKQDGVFELRAMLERDGRVVVAERITDTVCEPLAERAWHSIERALAT
jgi:hydroxymethylbilane synthase